MEVRHKSFICLSWTTVYMLHNYAGKFGIWVGNQQWMLRASCACLRWINSDSSDSPCETLPSTTPFLVCLFPVAQENRLTKNLLQVSLVSGIGVSTYNNLRRSQDGWSIYKYLGWTFQGVTINNCQVGFDLTTGGLTEAGQVTKPLFSSYWMTMVN